MKRSHGRHMKERYSRFVPIFIFLMTVTLFLSACGSGAAETDAAPATEAERTEESEVSADTDAIPAVEAENEVSAETDAAPAAEAEKMREPEVPAGGPQDTKDTAAQTESERKPEAALPAKEQAAGSVSSVEEIVNSFETEYIEVPEYAGDAYIVINDNIPFFTKSNLPTESFEYYSDLDDLGRCGIACANIGQDIMPTKEREGIGQVKPSGWQTVKYDNVDGKYLYNRCHLIGYQLSAENANEKNLITGTRYMNIEGMLPFENMVADYVKETGNHVLYRVNPLFEDDDLLAYGVLMEGFSVEDEGDGICFNVFVYNVQPDIVIDYANGDSYPDESMSAADEVSETQGDAKSNTPAAPGSIEQQTDSAPAGTDYILNINSKKFHYPDCKSIKQMAEKNKQAYSGNRDDVIAMGYVPCQNCNP